MHLPQLARLAHSMGWLSAPVQDQVIEILNTSRTMAAHPGAYVRGIRQLGDAEPDLNLSDPGWYGYTYKIVVEAYRELFTGMQILSS